MVEAGLCLKIEEFFCFRSLLPGTLVNVIEVIGQRRPANLGAFESKRNFY